MKDQFRVRPAARNDIPALVELCEEVFGTTWISRHLDLIDPTGPGAAPHARTLVAEMGNGTIAASASAVVHKWTIRGTSVDVMTLEDVGTRSSYRGHGLARSLIEALQGEHVDQVQAVFGIPGMYHRFGYLPAFSAGSRPLGRNDDQSDVSRLVVREAGPADRGVVRSAVRQASTRSPVAFVWDEGVVDRALGQRTDNPLGRRFAVLVDEDTAQPVGLLAHERMTRGGVLHCDMIEPLEPRFHWVVSQAAAAELWRVLPEVPSMSGGSGEAISLDLASGHPALAALGAVSSPSSDGLWRLRVSDPVSLFCGVLEGMSKRLPNVGLADARIRFRVVLEDAAATVSIADGVVTAVPSDLDRNSQADVFLSTPALVELVCGRRDLATLAVDFYDEVRVRNDVVGALLSVLLPASVAAPLPVW